VRSTILFSDPEIEGKWQMSLRASLDSKRMTRSHLPNSLTAMVNTTNIARHPRKFEPKIQLNQITIKLETLKKEFDKPSPECEQLQIIKRKRLRWTCGVSETNSILDLFFLLKLLPLEKVQVWPYPQRDWEAFGNEIFTWITCCLRMSWMQSH